MPPRRRAVAQFGTAASVGSGAVVRLPGVGRRSGTLAFRSPLCSARPSAPGAQSASPAHGGESTLPGGRGRARVDRGCGGGGGRGRVRGRHGPVRVAPAAVDAPPGRRVLRPAAAPADAAAPGGAGVGHRLPGRLLPGAVAVGLAVHRPGLAAGTGGADGGRGRSRPRPPRGALTAASRRPSGGSTTVRRPPGGAVTVPPLLRRGGGR